MADGALFRGLKHHPAAIVGEVEADVEAIAQTCGLPLRGVSKEVLANLPPSAPFVFGAAEVKSRSPRNTLFTCRGQTR